MGEEYDLPPRLVTDELVKDLTSGKITGSDVGATIPGISGERQPQFIFELCETYAHGKLELDKFFEGIKAAGLNGDLGTDLAHAIWLLALRPGVKQELLGELTAECIKKGKLSRRTALEVEDAELMAQAGLTTNAGFYLGKERKLFTALFYKQDKYNLLREENEGYAKLLTLLLSGGTLQQEHLPALTREVKGLIGTFKLDPNRVCDLVLDAAERDEAGVGAWLQLLGLFNKQAPMQMLAMKFLHYQQDHRHLSAGEDEGKAADQARRPPGSLYQLATAMIKAGLVSLEGLLSYLSPSADSLAVSYKEALEKLQAEVKELGQVVLGGDDGTAGKDGTGGTAVADGTGGRRLALLSGNLDVLAKERGITDNVEDGFGGRGGRGPIMGPGPGGMGHPPGLPPSGMWPRGGMPPPGMPMPGHAMAGGGMAMGGPPGGMYQGGMMQNGPAGGGSGMMMGGGGMMRGGGGAAGGGMMPPPGAAAAGASGGGGARGGVGGSGSEAYAAVYNVMPASQLELDARAYDKSLLDGSNSHLQLLLAMMKVGDWEHAMLMLDYLQSVHGVQAANDIAISTAMLAHLKKLLDPVYKALYPKGPLGGSVLRRPPYNLNLDDNRASAGGQNPAGPEALNPPGPALEPLVYQLLGHAGVYMYRDPEVLGMLLRVLKHELLFFGRMCPREWEQQQGQQQVDSAKVAQVVKVLAEVAFPALALNQSNRALSTELWDVLELMPFPYRAEVYRQALAACSACPPAAAAGQLAVKAFKRIKARLALPDKADKSRKDVVRANAYLLSKVTHATPLQVADQVMWWACTTPKAIEPLAEVMKLPNPLTMDSLTYMVLYWWGRVGRDKMKEDGANEADWVAGLADLVGYACRAHPHHSFNLSIILGFLYDELRSGETLSVLLLRCILSKMTGIDGPVTLDPQQAALLCAGHKLQAEIIHSVANRAESRFQKGRRAVLEVLQEGASDQQLLLPLAVVMSQHLDWALYALSTKHLKEIAELHDRVNEITQQYLMVLEHCMAKDKALSLEEYARTLPPPHALIAEYGVHPGIAWMLWRPVVVALEPQLMAKLEANAAAAAAAAGEEGDDADMLQLLAADGGGGVKPASSADGEEGELPEEGEAMQGVEGPGAKQAAATAAAAAAAADAAAAVAAAAAVDFPVTLADLTASVQRIEPDMFTNLTESLYVAFWSLRPEEIHVPTEEYDKCLSQMEAMIKTGPREVQNLQSALDTERRGLERLLMGGARGSQRDHDQAYNRFVDNITAKENSLAEAKQKLEHCQAMAGPLRAERDTLLSRHQQVMRRMEAEKDTYAHKKNKYKSLCYAFLKHCLVPRLTLSVADATFCHYFVMALHKIDTPNWPAAFLWDYAVVSLTNMIPTVTEKEALCVGVFLTLLLQALQVWYFDGARYQRDCSQQTMRQSSINSSWFSHFEFQKLFKKWQSELFKSLKACATSTEYLQKRNALLIMSKMIQAASPEQPPMFPFYKNHSEALRTVMTEIKEGDRRQDVQQMAQALSIQLANTYDRCENQPQALGGKGKAPVRAPPGKGRPAASALGRKQPPPSPGKQPGSRPSTPPPAAAAVAAGGAKPEQVSAEKAADRDAEKPAPAAAAAAAGGAPTTAPAAGGSTGGTGSAGGTSGPRAVRKAPARAPAAAAAAAAKQAVAAAATAAAAVSAGGGGTSGTPGGTPGGTGSKPPRAAGAAAEGEPARKRARVTPPSSKAEAGTTAAAAAAAEDHEPGEVAQSQPAAAATQGDKKPSAKPPAAVAAADGGSAGKGSKGATAAAKAGGGSGGGSAAAAAGDKKLAAAATGAAAGATAAREGAASGSASKVKKELAQKVVKKAAGAAGAAADGKGRKSDAAAAAAAPKAAGQQQQQPKPESVADQKQQQQQKQDDQKQQHKHEDRHGGDRHATPQRRQHQTHQQQQQQQQGKEVAGAGEEAGSKGDRSKEREGSRDGRQEGKERERAGQQKQQEEEADGGKGSSRKGRKGHEQSDRDRSRDGGRQQQQHAQRDGDAGAGAKEQQQQQREKDKDKEHEKDRKRDRREQKSDKQQQQQQREDRRERGSEEKGRDESSEPAKRRRVDDEEPQQQQQERHSSGTGGGTGGGHKEQQQLQPELQRQRSKHTPIMAPPAEERPSRKDSGGHDRADDRPHGRGRR